MDRIKLKKTISTSLAAISLLSAMSTIPVEAASSIVYADSTGGYAECTTTGSNYASVQIHLSFENGSPPDAVDGVTGGTARASMSVSSYPSYGDIRKITARTFENFAQIDCAIWPNP